MFRNSKETRTSFKPHFDFEKLIEQVESMALNPHTHISKRMA